MSATWFGVVWDELTSLIDKPNVYIQFVLNLIRRIIEGGGIILIEAAREAVAQAEKTGTNGENKYEFALHFIIQELESKGVPVLLDAVNGAIEAAVAELKTNEVQVNDTNS